MMSRTSLEDFKKISAMAALAHRALDYPNGHHDIGAITAVLEAIKERAETAMALITDEGDQLGADAEDALPRLRAAAGWPDTEDLERAQRAFILSEAEVVAISGGYRRASRQLVELRQQGFFRARISQFTGRVVLEREHYSAVCQGITLKNGTDHGPRPKVRPLK